MRPDPTAGLSARAGPLFTELGILTTFNISKFTKLSSAATFSKFIYFKQPSLTGIKTSYTQFHNTNVRAISISPRYRCCCVRDIGWTGTVVDGVLEQTLCCISYKRLERLKYDCIGEHKKIIPELTLTRNINSKIEGTAFVLRDILFRSDRNYFFTFLRRSGASAMSA